MTPFFSFSRCSSALSFFFSQPLPFFQERERLSPAAAAAAPADRARERERSFRERRQERAERKRLLSLAPLEQRGVKQREREWKKKRRREGARCAFFFFLLLFSLLRSKESSLVSYDREELRSTFSLPSPSRVSPRAKQHPLVATPQRAQAAACASELLVFESERALQWRPPPPLSSLHENEKRTAPLFSSRSTTEKSTRLSPPHQPKNIQCRRSTSSRPSTACWAACST